MPLTRLKRVLFIAYFFPPLGGAGVQRSLKFVRYLPQFGWTPVVLTGPAAYWIRDETLLREIPPDLEIHRAVQYGARFTGGGAGTTRRSAGKIRLLRNVVRSVLVPDAYIGWSLPAKRLATRILADRTIDAIFTTSSPDSTHLIGRALRRSTGLPWIADFRDPWTQRLSFAPPTALHERLHLALEASVLRSADRIIVTAEETREDFLRRHRVAAEKIIVIPNGFDEEDFAHADAERASVGRPPTQQPAAPILHAGQLNLERPLSPYLAGLAHFLERTPERRHEVETLFLGAHYASHVAEVERFGLSDVIHFAGNVTHHESIAALQRARVLLLLEQDSDRGRLVLPGKVFEYGRSGRPILGLVPTGGAAARFLGETGSGIAVDPSRPEQVAAALERLLQRGPEGGASSDVMERFERRVLTRQLAGVFDQVSRASADEPHS